VFTGGVEENDREAHAEICNGLSWMGVCVDPARNRAVTNPNKGRASRREIRVLTSQEDEQVRA